MHSSSTNIERFTGLTDAPLPTAIAKPVAAPPSTSAAAVAQTDAETRAAVSAAFHAQQTRAYRQTSDTVLKDGTTHQSIVEFAPPDKYHIVADATTELIIIGEKVFLKDKTTWTEPGIPADQLPYKLVVEGETAAMDNSTGQVMGVPATTTIAYEYNPAIQIAAPK